MPIEQVRVQVATTDAFEADSGAGGSRVTHVAGQATYQAAEELKTFICEVAAQLLGCQPNEVTLSGGRCAVAANGERSLSLADVARAALAHERLGHYVLEAEVEVGWEQVEVQMLAACRRAVELVPAEPPTALRARVAAGLARALAVTGASDEARRWAEEALATAKAAGSAEDESHALATLGTLELRRDNVAAARSLLRDAHRRAAATGSRPLELRVTDRCRHGRANAALLDLICAPGFSSGRSARAVLCAIASNRSTRSPLV